MSTSEKRALIYWAGTAPDGDTQMNGASKAAASCSRVLFRNARAFIPAEIESADLIVTDSETVRAAYEAAGVKVVALTSSTAPSPKRRAKRTTQQMT